MVWLLHIVKIQKSNQYQMDSESNPQKRQQRRKRKDSDNRDFSCECGKKYLSYAAVYTHVKTKHNGNQQYFNKIKKPDRQPLKRGRPKQKKIFSFTTEAKKLSIVQYAILQIYQLLDQEKIILEGNQQIRLDQLIKSYYELIKQIGEPGLTLFVDRDKYGLLGKTLNQFIESFNKHFISRIASKVIWFVNFILAEEVKNGHESGEINMENIRKRMHEERQMCKKVWDGKQSISVCIIEALEKYLKTNQNNTEGSDKNQ